MIAKHIHSNSPFLISHSPLSSEKEKAPLIPRH